MASPILITGPRGLLGATLMRVVPGAMAYEGDIRDTEGLMVHMGAVSPSWVVHTAALTDVGRCEREPEAARAVNADGTKNVVSAARACGTRVIYISTASVFKGDSGDYREEDTPQPLNVYNETKRAGELHILEYDRGLVLRLNLVGIHPNGSRGRNFLEWLADSFAGGKDMTVFEDAYINPLSNWTIAAYIQNIIAQDSNERILHIGSGDALSKADIADLVHKYFPTYQGIMRRGSIESIADGVFRPKQMWLNTNLAANLLGPMPSLAQELEKVFKVV